MTTQNTTTTPRTKLTTPEMNAVRIMMSDHYSTIHQYDDSTMQIFYAKLGHLTAMLDGQIPFEGTPSYTPLPQLEDVPGERLFTHKFYARRDDMRALKMALLDNMCLLHMPHTMTTTDPAIIYSSVRSSAAAALRSYEANASFMLGFSRREGKEEVFLVNPYRSTTSVETQEEEAEMPSLEETIDETSDEIVEPETFGDVLEKDDTEEEESEDESSVQEIAPLYEEEHEDDSDLSDV